jgi:hypothetical protein
VPRFAVIKRSIRFSACRAWRRPPHPGATAVLVDELDRLGESGDLRNFSAGGNFAK